LVNENAGVGGSLSHVTSVGHESGGFFRAPSLGTTSDRAVWALIAEDTKRRLPRTGSHL
jgi:hypothetical protein